VGGLWLSSQGCMSMQMAKRVSLIRPWGLNRSPHEIEPLGTTSSTLSSDRMRRSGWPDACHPASGRVMCATWPLGSTLSAWSQRSNDSVRRLKWWLDAVNHRLMLHVTSDQHCPTCLRPSTGCADHLSSPRVRSVPESSPSA
jgi:hypothetical protein